MSIEVVEGDLFESPCQTLGNATNTKGVMGAGIAAAFKQRYPEMFKEYVEKCKKSEASYPYVWKGPEKWVLNFPTMFEPGQMGSYSMLGVGFVVLQENYENWGITSLALPALGCGIGGLNFDEVVKTAEECLEGVEIPIQLFKPFD